MQACVGSILEESTLASFQMPSLLHPKQRKVAKAEYRGGAKY
jgi:hypothetical protein